MASNHSWRPGPTDSHPLAWQASRKLPGFSVEKVRASDIVNPNESSSSSAKQEPPGSGRKYRRIQGSLEVQGHRPISGHGFGWGAGNGPVSSFIRRLLRRIAVTEDEEIPSVVRAFCAFMLLMAAYFVCLPLRDEAGMSLGTGALPYLFVASLFVTLLAAPASSSLLTRSDISKGQALHLLYRFFAISLLGFFCIYLVVPGNAPESGTSKRIPEDLGAFADVTLPFLAARASFFLWVALFNLFTVSAMWARLADVMTSEAGARLFGFIGAGATIGQLAGSLLSSALVWAGPALLVVAAALMELAGRCAAHVTDLPRSHGEAESNVGLEDETKLALDQTTEATHAPRKAESKMDAVVEKAVWSPHGPAEADGTKLWSPHGTGVDLQSKKDEKMLESNISSEDGKEGLEEKSRERVEARGGESSPGLSGTGKCRHNPNSPESRTDKTLISSSGATRAVEGLGSLEPQSTVGRSGQTESMPLLPITTSAEECLEAASPSHVKVSEAPSSGLGVPRNGGARPVQRTDPPRARGSCGMEGGDVGGAAGSRPSKHRIGRRAEGEGPWRKAGRPAEGLRLILRSGYLLHVCFFLLMTAVISSFFYFERAAVVAGTTDDPVARRQMLANINSLSAVATVLFQLTLTGRLLASVGVALALCAAPLAAFLGMIAIALRPTPAVVGLSEASRKVVNYVLTRPGREILFTVISREEKYKAKVTIDTLVQRLGDAAAAGVFHMLGGGLRLGPAGVATCAIPMCVVWLVSGFLLGRRQQAMARKAKSSLT